MEARGWGGNCAACFGGRNQNGAAVEDVEKGGGRWTYLPDEIANYEALQGVDIRKVGHPAEGYPDGACRFAAHEVMVVPAHSTSRMALLHQISVHPHVEGTGTWGVIIPSEEQRAKPAIRNGSDAEGW